MGKSKGLVIIHVDGLGYHYLQKALSQGRMPFVQHLIANEGYEPLRYRCGVPSTTPFSQAGILFGDNSEIPSFRWWDKESGVPVSFGATSAFKQIAHKYFRDSDSLTRGGASIATCYPASSNNPYRLGYREHGHALEGQAFSQRRAIVTWAMNPIHLLDWLRRGVWHLFLANLQYWQTRLRGGRVAKMYVISDMLEEIMVHHLTRFAVIQAMKENSPTIYVAFYAYDETAHAFGPDADYSFDILRHIDNTIRRIAAKRQRDQFDALAYELVILSDHGQIETMPFDLKYHKRIGEIVAEFLPTYEVEETKGKIYKPKQAIDGHIGLTYSGGLAHLYFKNISPRLQHREIQERFPGLIETIARTPGIGFVLTRDGASNMITAGDRQIQFDARLPLSPDAREVLSRYDEPEIIARQLHKLNSFERSGDLIFFGEHADGHQINFENQVGGHGSIGGEQMFPFILVKRDWGFDTSNVSDASDLHSQLKRLRDRLSS